LLFADWGKELTDEGLRGLPLLACRGELPPTAAKRKMAIAQQEVAAAG
jgi:hypothetical protein